MTFGVQATAAIFIVAALAVAAWRLGRVLAARWLPESSNAELLATGLALGLIGHGVFAVGLVGALGRWLPVAVSIAAVLSLPAAKVAWSRRLRGRASVVAATLALLPLALAFLPPTGWDATEYHLALVKGYVLSHRVAPAWTLRYPVFPQLTEMISTIGYLAGGAVAATLTPALFVAITAAAVYGWGARYFSSGVGVTAAALWLGQPMIVFLGTNLYVDAGLTCYATLAALAVGSAWLDGDERWIPFAGLAAGFAASCKYLGLPFAAVLLAASMVITRQRVRAALNYGLPMLAASLPWYIYNFVHTHNPVFPFAGHWFGYGSWNAEDLALQMAEMRSHGVGHSVGALALLPWSLTVAQTRFQVEAPFEPVFLPALALALWGARDRRVRALLVIVMAYGLFWFCSIQLLRYLVLPSALFCLAVASAAERVRLPGPLRRWLPLALVAPSLVYAAERLRGGFPVSAAAREVYLVRHLPGYDAVVALNRSRPAGYRAYGLHLERLNYFAEGALVGDGFGPARFRDVYARLGDPQALGAHLRQLGVDTLIVPVSDCPLTRLRAPDFMTWFDVVATHPDANTLQLRGDPMPPSSGGGGR